jgi:DNA polymerase (family 10)
MPVHNAEIAAMFDQAAELLEIKGDNPFRTRAYRRAARTIEGWPKSVAGLLKAGEDLSELPGIGKDLAGKIATIVATGKFELLESLKHELPGELGEIATLPGLGPKRVKQLYDELGVRSIEDLRRAAKAGRLRELHGFGERTEAKLLAALAKPVAEKRIRIDIAEAEAGSLTAYMRQVIGKGQIIVAGSYRRRRDTVGDLDILATARNGRAVGEWLTKYENVASVVAHGASRTTVMLRSGLQTIAKAQQWMDEIMMEKAKSLEEIADRENLAERYVRRLAVLAFLSPKIVAAIIDETAPADLTVTSLTQALPHCWTAQEQMFGVH